MGSKEKINFCFVIQRKAYQNDGANEVNSL